MDRKLGILWGEKTQSNDGELQSNNCIISNVFFSAAAAHCIDFVIEDFFWILN